jgi:hypothetical protein
MVGEIFGRGSGLPPARGEAAGAQRARHIGDQGLLQLADDGPTSAVVAATALETMTMRAPDVRSTTGKSRAVSAACPR